MSIFGTVLQVAGIGLGAYSSFKQSQAVEDRSQRQAQEVKDTSEFNRMLSLYDASISEKEAQQQIYKTNVALKIHMKNTANLISSQRARYAKAGVAPGTGTPLDVQADTAAAAARDGQMILFNGLTAAERKRDLAKRFRLLADEGLRDAAAKASMIEEAGAAESKMYQLETFGRVAEGVYTLGDQLDWF